MTDLTFPAFDLKFVELIRSSVLLSSAISVSFHSTRRDARATRIAKQNKHSVDSAIILLVKCSAINLYNQTQCIDRFNPLFQGMLEKVLMLRPLQFSGFFITQKNTVKGSTCVNL